MGIGIPVRFFLIFWSGRATSRTAGGDDGAEREFFFSLGRIVSHCRGSCGVGPPPPPPPPPLPPPPATRKARLPPCVRGTTNHKKKDGLQDGFKVEFVNTSKYQVEGGTDLVRATKDLIEAHCHVYSHALLAAYRSFTDDELTI